jgi:Zn-dependent membrane protease YugP/tetratricopeptide (TPR) repeat protein
MLSWHEIAPRETLFMLEFLDIADGLFEGWDFSALILLLIVPALLFTARATRGFKSVLDRYLQVPSGNGFTGNTAAKALLDQAGIVGVKIVPTPGIWITDHYKPLSRELVLSQAIYAGCSLSAVGIAAHEVGHAIQHARGDRLSRWRRLLVPVTRLCWMLGATGIAVGMLDASGLLLWLGFGFLACCLVFPLVTLPVEFDASIRGRVLAMEANVIRPEEMEGVERVLRAAAFTYVAAAVRIGLGLLTMGVVLVLWGPCFPDMLTGDSPFGTIIAFGSFLAIIMVLTRSRKRAVPPSTAAEHNATGDLLAEQGQLAEAIAAYTKAIRLCPHLAEAYANRGAIYLRAAQLDEALADLDTAIRLAPALAEAHACRGHVHGYRGEYDQALADYEAAARRAPKGFPILYASQAAVWQTRSEYDRAIALYTQALDQGAQRAPVLRDRGLAWYHKGDLHRAVADLDDSIRLDAKDATAYNNRGAAHLKLGDYTQAIADLRTAIRLKPDFPNGYKNLAWLQATCPESAVRNGADAVANASRALELSGSKPAAWLEILAAAYAEAGDFEQAVNWQTKGLEGCLPADRADAQARLDLYRFRQPYRAQPSRPTVQPDKEELGMDDSAAEQPAPPDQPLVASAR